MIESGTETGIVIYRGHELLHEERKLRSRMTMLETTADMATDHAIEIVRLPHLNSNSRPPLKLLVQTQLYSPNFNN